METPTSTGTATQPEPLKPWKQVAEESNIFSLPPEQRLAEYDKWSSRVVEQGIRNGDFDSRETFNKFKLKDIRTRKNLASDDIIGPSDDEVIADYEAFKGAFASTQAAFSANKPTPQDEAIQGEVLQGKRNAAFVRGQMVFNPAVVNDPQKYREAILESDAPADIKMFYAGLRPEMEKSATVTRRRELASDVITRDVADKVVTAIQEGTELFGADIGTPQSPALKKNKDGVWSVVDPEYVDQSASMLDIANARYNPLGDSQYKPLPAINEYQKKYGLTDEQVQQDYMESLIENAPTTVNRWLGKATSIEDYVKQLDSTVRVKNKDVAPEVRVQDPNLFFDEQGYNAAVDKANAPDEAKNLAKAARTQFADAVAGDIYNNLLNNRDDFRENYAKDVVDRKDMEKAITRYYKDKKDQAWYDDVGEVIGQAGTAAWQGLKDLVMMPSAIKGMFGDVEAAENYRYHMLAQQGEMQAEEAVANRTGGAGFIKLNNDVMRIIPDLVVQMGIAVATGGTLSGAQASLVAARTGISRAAATTALRQAAITGEKAALKSQLLRIIPEVTASTVDDVAEEVLKASARTASNNPFKGGIGTQRAVGSAYAGLTSAASTFGQVYTDVVKMGKSPEEAIATARTAGVVAGAITSGLTHSFGMLGRGGVEDFASMGRKAGDFTIRDIVNAGLLDSLTTQEGRQLMRNIAKGISKDALSEGAEEGLDQALNLISQYATNPSPEAQNRKATDIINESLYASLLGGIAGGGAASVGQARATAPGITAQQMQAEILGAQQPPVAPQAAAPPQQPTTQPPQQQAPQPPVAPAPTAQPQQPIAQPAAVPPITPEEQANYDAAKAVVIAEQSASISLLQRKLRLGYGRAQRIMDLLEQDGIIAPKTGAGSQSVLVQPQTPVVQPSANPAVQEAQATVESLAEIPDTTQTAAALAALANAATVPKPEFNLPEIDVPAEPAPEAQPEEEVVTPETPAPEAEAPVNAEETPVEPAPTVAKVELEPTENMKTPVRDTTKPEQKAEAPVEVKAETATTQVIPEKTLKEISAYPDFSNRVTNGNMLDASDVSRYLAFRESTTSIPKADVAKAKKDLKNPTVSEIEAALSKYAEERNQKAQEGKDISAALKRTGESDELDTAISNYNQAKTNLDSARVKRKNPISGSQWEAKFLPSQVGDAQRKLSDAGKKLIAVAEKTKQPQPTKPDAVQKPSSDAGVLRQEGQEVGLPEVDQGGRGAKQEGAGQEGEVIIPLTEAQTSRLNKIPELEALDAQRRGLGFNYPTSRIRRLPGDPNAYVSRSDKNRVGVTAPDGSISMLSAEESVLILDKINAFEKRQEDQLKQDAAQAAQESQKQEEGKFYRLSPSSPVVRRLKGKWINHFTGKPLGNSKNDQRLLSELEDNPNIELYRVVAKKLGDGVAYVSPEKAGQEETKPELTRTQEEVVVFIEQETDDTEKAIIAAEKKPRITPGKARKVGIAKQIERLGINSNDPDSVISALEKIANNPKPKPSEKHHARIAKDLLSVLKGSGVQIQLVSGNDAKLSEGDSRVNGWYDPKTNTAYINLDGPHELGIEETILHELVHASGEKVIQNPETEAQKRILGDLEKQMLTARKNAIALGQAKMGVDVTDLNILIDMAASQNDYGLFDILYGVSSLSEYHAHATTSRSFQKFLATYKEGGKRSLFERFVNSITSLLSGKKTAENSDAEKAYATLLDLMREGKGDVRKPNTDTVQSRARGIDNEQDSTFVELERRFKAGDKGAEEEARKLIEKIAKEQGWTENAYHGTGASFTVFDSGLGGSVTGARSARLAFFLTDDPDIAKQYAKLAAMESLDGSERVISAFVKGNLKTVDHGGKEYEERKFSAEIRQALDEGYDGVKFVNTDDSVFKELIGYEPIPEIVVTPYNDGSGMTLQRGDFRVRAEYLPNGFTRMIKPGGDANLIRSRDTAVIREEFDKLSQIVVKPKAKYKDQRHSVFAVFDPNQIKSADPFTYDDNGNLILPSERFQPESPDIRFSRARGVSAEQDSEYLAAVSAGNTAKAQQMVDGIIPEAQEGMTRLWRSDAAKVGTAIPSWMESTEELQGIKDASGRWFYKTKKEAERHMADFEGESLSFVDVPSESVESFNAKDNPFAGGYGKQGFEYFVPRQIAERRISTAAILRDGNGNVIPLSQRLNPIPIKSPQSKARGIVSDTVTKYAPEFNVVDDNGGPSVFFDGRNVTVNPSKLEGLDEYEVKDLAERAVVAAKAAPKDPITAGIIQQTDMYDPYNFDSVSRKEIRKSLAKAHAVATENGMAPLAMDLGVKLFEYGGATDAEVRKSMARGTTSDEEYLAAVEAGDMEKAQKMADAAAKAAGYNIGPVWHKTLADFSIFDLSKSSHSAVWGPAIYASFNKDWNPASLSGGRVITGFVGGAVIDMTKPLTQEAESMLSDLLGREIREVVPFLSLEKRFGSVAEGLRAAGFSAAIHDGPGGTGRHIAVFSPEQIKSADPVTRDDAGNVIPLSQRFQSTSPDIRYSRARGTELVTYIPRTYSAPRLLFNKLIAGFRSRGMVTEAAYEKFRDFEGFKKANESLISFIANDFSKVANKYFGEGEESWLDFRVFSRDAAGEVTVSKKGFKTQQEAESFAKVSGSKDYIVATGQDLMNKALGSNSHTLKEDVRDKIEKLTKKGLDDIANSIKAYKEEYLNYWNLVTLEMQASSIDEKQIATLKEKKQQWMRALELREAEQRKIVDDARKEAVRAALADGTNRIIAQQEFAKAYLPDDLVYQIGRARGKIDELSKQIMGIEWLMDGSENQMIIGERLEVYVTRSYEAFETKDRVGYVNWLKEAYQALYQPGKAYDPLAMDRIMPLVRHIKETIVQRRIEDLVRENEQNQIDDIMAELIADPRQITQVDRIPGQPIEGTEYEQLVRAVAKKVLETRRSQEKKDFIERAITSLGRNGFASNIGDARKRKVALRKEANRLYEQRYPEQTAVSDIMGAPNPLRWAMMTETEAHDIANVERSLSESPGNINGSAIWTSSINGLKYSSFMAAVNDDFQKNLDYITGAPASKTGFRGAVADDWKRIDDKILEHKGNIPEFLRTFWGEKDNPLLRVSDTIMKQSHLVAVGELYKNLAKVGEDEGWLVGAQVKNSDSRYRDWKPILNSENTDQGYGSNPFKEMYADPVMIGAINTLLAANQPSNTATKVIARIIGYALWNVTAGSVKAIIRNLSAIGPFLLNSGLLSAILVPSRTIPVLKNVVLAARIMNESMTAVGKISGGKKIEGRVFRGLDWFWTGALATIAAQRPATAVIKGASSFAQFASRMKENPSSEQAQEMYQLAVKLGVANDNVQKESIQRLLDIEETISRKPVDRNLGKFAKALKLDGIVGFGSYLLGTIKTAGQQRSQLYGAPDDFTKILAWLNEMDAQARIHSKDKAEYNKWRGKDGLFTDMPEEHVRRAASYTTDLIQSHSKVWAHITQFKKMGFGTFIAPFIAARAEFYRNMVNAYRIAFTEMRSDIPLEKANGWMRFASALMAHFAYGTMASAVLKMIFRAFADDEEVVEDSPEIRDAIRRLAPEYAKNKIAASVLYKNGTFDWIDISFSTPFAFVWESIYAGRRAASDADVDDFVAWNVARDVLGENLGNFVSPQIAVGAGATVISGFDPVRGIKIWDSQADNTAEKVKKATIYYLKQAGLPGDWKSAMNIYNAAKGVEENGRKYKVGTEVAGVFLGASVRTIKVTDMVRQKLSQAKDNLNARITPFYNAQLGDSNVYGPEDFVDAAEKYHKTGQDAIKRMQRVVSAGRVLLAPAPDGEKMLRNVMNSDDVKMNATVERAIMSGKSVPSTLSPQTRQKVGALGKKHNDDRLPITEDTLKRLNQKP